MARVFISYKRVDKDKVFKIKDWIESELGEKCWIDLDGIESDAQFAYVIINAINECEIVLFMYSRAHSKISDFENDWTIRELNFARKKHKRVVFINVDNSELVDPAELYFGTQQQIDGTSQEALKKLIEDLRKWLKIYNRQNPSGEKKLAESQSSSQINNDSLGLEHKLPKWDIDEEGGMRKFDENLSNQINNYSRYLELIDEEGRKRKIEEQQHREELRIKKEKEERRIQQEEQARKNKIATQVSINPNRAINISKSPCPQTSLNKKSNSNYSWLVWCVNVAYWILVMYFSYKNLFLSWPEWSIWLTIAIGLAIGCIDNIILPSKNNKPHLLCIITSLVAIGIPALSLIFLLLG